MQLVLYTGPGCDLCDVAYSMVMQAPLNCQIVRRNVRDDLALYHRYGAKIPVLERVDSQAQLSWPFTQNELESFLQ
ncbi:glutaredoxin family protein [Alteromonas lipotrueiana]|uniref:glutaredoxin family protein n=1 Tax=Alteromonas lipotrueiana TaxID=2803815 RepID=UPI001C441CF1|nr:glutaredoxin family protein [Alteromonas lipotrueiana]